jgi:peptidoglycan/xylan/chitin deacetylase (PgdA/CDA1 family)
VTPLLYYHSVGGPPPQTLPLEDFRQHLEHIRKHGYTTRTVADLSLNGNRPRTVVLTFDDGLLDNYTKVFPLLLEFGMVATFYCVPAYDQTLRWVNPWTGQWSDSMEPGYTQPFRSVNAAQRQEMSRHGMEIGSHTYNHRKLTEVPLGELDHELCDSKARLEDELGKEVSTFCYPNGRFNPQIVARVRRAGYRAACSTIPGYYGWNRSPYLLNRFLIENSDYFEDVLLGRAFAPGPLARMLLRRARS